MSKKQANTLEKKQGSDNQLYWILGVMLAVIAVFFISAQILEKSSTVEYDGLTFTKVMFGEIPLYQYLYKTPTFAPSLTGKVIQSGERQAKLLLRNDPSKNTVPVYGEIDYPPRASTIYITFSSEGIVCNSSVIAVAGLTQFLKENSFNVQTGFATHKEADEFNETYVTCSSHPNNMVIHIQSGNESSVSIDGNCHTLTVGDCDVLSVTEKFIAQSVADAVRKSSS